MDPVLVPDVPDTHTERADRVLEVHLDRRGEPPCQTLGEPLDQGTAFITELADTGTRARPRPLWGTRTSGVRASLLVLIIEIDVIGIVRIIEDFWSLTACRRAFRRLFGDAGIGYCPRVPWAPRARTEDRRELAGELRPVPTLRRKPEAGAAPTSGAHVVDKLVAAQGLEV